MKIKSNETEKLFLMFSSIFLILGFGCLPSVNAYETVPLEKGGEISGKVILKGEVPVMQPRKVIRDLQVCGETVTDDTFFVNPSTHALQNVVISIEGISRGKTHPHSTVLLDNFKCHFKPRTIAAMVGDSYEVRNSDPVLHNTHLRQDDITILNVAMPPSGKNIKKPLSQAGMITVNCDAHAFMKGNILVFDHPYYAVTDAEGSYRITDIPPGKYKVKIWHDGTTAKEKEVTVNASRKTDLSVELSLP
jgi:plastocyanin